MAHDPALPGHGAQALHGIEVTPPRDMAEREHPGRGRQGGLDQPGNLFLALEGTRNEDRVHLDPVPHGPVLPRSPPGRMLLARDQHLVPGAQPNTHGTHVQRLGGVSGQHHFVAIGPEQGGQPRQHPRDVLAKVALPAQRLPRERLVARGDRLCHGNRWHAQAGVVHVGGAGFKDEEIADVGPCFVLDAPGAGQRGAPAGVACVRGAGTGRERGACESRGTRDEEATARELASVVRCHAGQRRFDVIGAV